MNTVPYSLPDELIIETLKLLDLHTLLRCRLVVSSWRKTIDSNTPLQYQLRLGVAGMEDNLSSRVPVAERMRMLREHQHAWSTLQWQTTSRIPKLGENIWELYGNVLAQGIDSNSIRFQQIPSILRCIPDALPWDVRANFHIHDFGMDPAQDLLVLLEVAALGDSILYPASSRIHLVSLIDGKPHQRATSTVLEYTPPYFSLIWTYTVQTQGDFLGLLYHAPETLPPRATSRVVIWNWRTGILFADHFSHAIESFAFLDERRLLLGRILRTREDTDPAVGWKTPSLDIYTFRTTDEQPMPHHKALHLVSLSYPTLFPGASALGMIIRTDPAPRWTPPSTQAPPFNLNVHYVLRSALISQADQSKDHASEMPSRVEWDHWGPDTSRLLTNEPMDDSWVCYVYGMRLITAHVRRRRENVRNFDLKVTLRDFHGLAIRHDLGMEDLCDHNDLLGTSVALAGSICAAEPAHHHWRYRVEEIHDTVIDENEELFDKDVITTLPYREVSRVLPQEVYSGGKTAVMLSEDAILVVDLKDTSTGDERYITLLTF